MSYKTWYWFLFIHPPFSVYRCYFTSMEAEGYILLAPIHVAVCSYNWEGRVTLLNFLVTTVSHIKDWFGCWKVHYKLFCLGSWNYHIMAKNVYNNKTFLVSPAKPMVTSRSWTKQVCMDVTQINSHCWGGERKGNWDRIFKVQKIKILYNLFSCNLGPYSAKYWQIPIQLSIERCISKGFQVYEGLQRYFKGLSKHMFYRWPVPIESMENFLLGPF